jgi:hypothetical protein
MSVSSVHTTDTTPLENYTPAEIEFMEAMQTFRKERKRLFPTWRDVLEVLMSLGYAKVVR